MGRDQKVIIGVGGTVGAGKTIVAHIFRDFGAEYVSADAIGWEVLPAISGILQQEFGNEIMNGMDVDKKKLRKLVFSDPGKLSFLNRASHPILVRKVLDRVAGIKTGVVVIDAALLFDWDEVLEIVDYPILVTADRDKKRMRAHTKGIGDELFDRMTAMQKDEEEMAKRAKYVIENNGTVDQLKDRCLKIYKEIEDDCRV